MSKAATSPPLNLDVEFQNLGKINQATIKLRPFTVIAGCNGSGKSFITKSLYSVFSVMPSSAEEVLDNLHTSFTDNFMVSSLDHLVNSPHGSNIFIQLGETYPIEAMHDDFFIGGSTIELIGSINLHPPVYLESPIYWKLIDALEGSRETLSSKAQKRRLEKNQLVSQVPKYFFDLMELLEVQVKTDGFSDIVRSIEEAINGSLSFSDGNIQFSDKASNASVGLNLTALGVANLGMIALLLKRGAILPGTFLFIDEPEVHLHPAWQVVLIQVLHQLSKRGVNVVIASHSIDIMKAIENIMDSDGAIDPQTHFGINQLTKDGNSVNDSENNYKRLAAIKEDLGRPFYEMFMDGLEP